MQPTTLEGALKQIAKLKKDVAHLRGKEAFHAKVIKAASTMLALKGSITLKDWLSLFVKAQADDPGGSLNN